MAFQKQLADTVFSLGVLSPDGIGHHWYWQFLTYGFLHQDPLNFLLSMLAIYFIGASVQERIGSRAFTEMYLIAIVGAGILGYLMSLTGYFAQGMALGSGPAANAILMVFYLLFRDTPIFIFPLPIPIPTKYVVIFTAAVEGAYWLLTHFSLFFTVQLLGLVGRVCLVPAFVAPEKPGRRRGRPGIWRAQRILQMETTPRGEEVRSLYA